MALIDGLTFTQDANIATGVVADTSNYGVGGNPVRSAKANYLLWSKTDQNGNRVFDNPNPGDVLATLSYAVNTLKDGFYEGILVRVPLWSPDIDYVQEEQSSGVITQYASIVYYLGVVYQCIRNEVEGSVPPDPTTWIIAPSLSTILDNTNLDVFIKDFYIKVRSQACISGKFSKKACGCDQDKLRTRTLLWSDLVAADSEFSAGNPEEMDKIIREIEATCSTC